MNIGVLRVDLLLNDCGSLKDKRRVLGGLKARLKNNFNVSVAEIGDMDKWQKAVLAIAVISNDLSHLHGYLDNILDFIENEKKMVVIEHLVEIL